MSHKATHWLASIDPEALTDGEFRVLLALVNMHCAGRLLAPSQADLCRATGKANGSLNRALNGLQSKGFIRREQRHDAASRQRMTTVYHLCLDDEEHADA